MADKSFPSKELLEVIKGQARVEEKLDNFLRTQTSMSTTMSGLVSDVADLKSKRASDKAYVAGAAGVASIGMGFLIPYLKQKLGI